MKNELVCLKFVPSSVFWFYFSLKILERHLGEVTMRPDPDTLHTEGNPSTDPSRSQHSDHLFQSNKQTVSSASTQCGKLEDSVSAASSPKVLSTSLVSSLENQKAPLIMDKDTFLAIKAAIFQYRLNKADRKTKGHGVFSGNNPFKKLDVEEVGTEKETQRSIESHDTKPTTSLTDSEVFVSSFPSNFSKPTEEPLKRTSTTGPPRLRLSDSFETGQSQLLDKVVTSNSCLNLYFEKHPEISSQEGDHVIKHQPITDQNHGSTVKQQCKDVDVQQTPIDVCAVKDTGNKEVHEVDCLQLVSRNTRNEVRTIEDRSEGFRGRGTKLEPYKTFRNIRKQWDQIQKDKDSFKISDSVQVTDADDQTVMSKERTNLIDNKDSFGKIFNCDIRHPPKKKYKSSETQGRTLKTGESPGETVEVSQESQKNKETCEELSCQIMDSGEEEKVQSTSERFVSEEGKTKKPIERLGGDNKASSEVDVSVRGVNENIISTDYQSTVERKEGPKQQCTKLKKDGQDSPEIELDGNEMSSYFPDSLGNKGTIDYQLREDDTGILKENTCFNHFVEYLEEQQDEDQEAPLRAHVFSRETNETSQEDWNLMTLSEREKTSVSTGVNHKGVKGADSQEFIVPKCGYVCNLCCVFYLDEKRAKDLHCSGLRHHDNLQVPHLQVKSNTSNKNNKKNCCFCDIHFLVLLFRSTTRTMCVQNIRTPISTLSKIQPLTCLFKIRI
ncbi:uncharacterized protein LOC103388929 isoform X2 [Cynoglossus semilaevis]|uniref:uncharacterized protein LOC103388929 isoform X2 n=1 Tax=Cynoglossus semilaevis TaxID=244447 RepID=UPI000D626FAF|nr:uncharacterized protein LOC103388929 isoform X2 [Cynoglossus semilaevis]